MDQIMSYEPQATPPSTYPPPPPMGMPPQQPQQGRSGLAVAGLILAFLVAPVGFILSLIALFTTGKGRKGRGMAVAGLIVSTVIIGGITAAIIAVTSSTVADPGCTSGKSAILDNAANASPATLPTIIDGLNAAAAKAKHDNVRTAMKALADDYSQLLSATKTGQVPPGLEAKITKDLETVDSLCTIGS
jgi:ABC-type transport system involved in multi-copper enzyme maturation permease subunit